MFIIKETHTGIMIALMIPDTISRYISNKLESVQFPKGSEVLQMHDHHITLLYFEQGQINIEYLDTILETFAYDLEGQYVDFMLSGIDSFENDQRAIFVPVYDGSHTNGVKAFQQELCIRIGYAMNVGNDLLYRYSRFQPHMTVAYVPMEIEWNYIEALSNNVVTGTYVKMESFSLVNGNDRKDYKFNLNL